MSHKSAIAIRGPLIKTAVFAVLTSMVLVFVSIELGGFRFYATNSYTAEFTDASSVLDGDPVMVNGVPVGKVSDVSVRGDAAAEVRFDLEKDIHLPEDTEVAVRYKDLTGDRYLEISPGSATTMLEAGATIPEARTTPALDLDELLGGLQPLFQGLDPTQLNKLSAELVSVLQGQGGSIQDVLRQTTAVASTLSKRDALIGSTVENLNSVLANLDSHDEELNQTIAGLDRLTSGLAGDRRKVGRSFDQLATLSTSLGGLLGDLRGPLKGLVKQVGRVATNVDDNADDLNELLTELPGDYLRIGRVGSRGAAYNIYLCSVRIRLTGTGGKPIYTPWIGPDPTLDRCQRDTAPIETPAERKIKEQKGIFD